MRRIWIPERFPIRCERRFILVVVLLFAARSASARTDLEDSRYLERIPAPGACDVLVTPANAATALAQINDPAKRVFCVQPGDYRGRGEVLITASGTQQNRRFRGTRSGTSAASGPSSAACCGCCAALAGTAFDTSPVDRPAGDAVADQRPLVM